jgi:hypothetical protein
MAQHLEEFLNVSCGHRDCVVGGSRAAMFVTFDNCRLRKVRRELIIGCLSNTSLPFLVGLFVCFEGQIDASLLDTETRPLGYKILPAES